MKASKSIKRILFFCLVMVSISSNAAYAQTKVSQKATKKFSISSPRDLIIKYGVASYYAAKFHGRKTASGEVYRKELITAACNVLPLNTWVKVTNLANNNFVIAKINDRLAPQNKRLVDLSSAAAKQLGYISDGLAKVKVEVLENYDPSQGISQN